MTQLEADLDKILEELVANQHYEIVIFGENPQVDKDIAEAKTALLKLIQEAQIDEIESIYIAYGTDRSAKLFHIPDGKEPLQPLEERIKQLQGEQE